MTAIHPELVSIARVLPRGVVKSWTISVLRAADRLVPSRRRIGSVAIETVFVPGVDGAPDVRVRVFRPDGRATPSPALVWMHGGGYVIGRAESDDGECAHFATALGCLVVSVDYRLAPEHPYPAAVSDCEAALAWTVREAASLGVDTARVAIGGESAGGGLTAQLALRVNDRADLRPCFQLLVYPMLDDRSAGRPDLDAPGQRIWNRDSNRLGWRAYLGREPGSDDVPDLAAPGRRAELSGLPPAHVSVGALDLFFEEDVAYAERLKRRGVACELDVVAGAFHGFNRVAGKSMVARKFREAQVAALRRAFAG